MNERKNAPVISVFFLQFSSNLCWFTIAKTEATKVAFWGVSVFACLNWPCTKIFGKIGWHQRWPIAVQCANKAAQTDWVSKQRIMRSAHTTVFVLNEKFSHIIFPLPLRKAVRSNTHWAGWCAWCAFCSFSFERLRFLRTKSTFHEEEAAKKS